MRRLILRQWELIVPGKVGNFFYFMLSTLAYVFAAAAAKSLQSCLTLCDPIDSSPPGSPVPGILQARTLEWVAISFSNAWKWKVKGRSLSCVRLFTTPWTAAYQAPLSMGFSRQEYWSGVPSPEMNVISSANWILQRTINYVNLAHCTMRPWACSGRIVKSLRTEVLNLGPLGYK